MSQTFFQDAKDLKIYGGYQFAAAPGSSVTINQAAQARALDSLSTATAHTALHDSATRFPIQRCHRNTRTAYLDGLEHWMRGLPSKYDDKRLLWLNGGAGAGKSAIMQSIVERCAQYAVILGAFFFSRDDPSRNSAEVLIPTLAYQLACDYPSAMAVLEPIIQHNPLIFKASLRTQAEKLLVHPLRHLVETGVIDTTSPLRRVFVIDGLDECDNRDEQAQIIRVIAAVLCDHDVPVSFLIASRPETAISRAFQTENRVHSALSSITLGDDDDARSDIRQFIEDSFLDICDTHPQRKHIPPNWPDQESIKQLVEKSSGHFVYAAIAMKFISSSDELPDRALQVLEGLASTRTGNPFAELDALYLHIITSAKHSSQVLKILRHCVLTWHLDKDVRTICFIYPDFSPQDVELFLSDVQALVSLSPGAGAELRIFLKHASLRDFFWNVNRADGIYMSAGDYGASLLPRYFMFFDDSSLLSFPDGRLRPHSFIQELTIAIRNSQDFGLLQSLIRMYSPQRVWSFCLGPSGENVPIPAYRSDHPRNIAIFAVSLYLKSIIILAIDHDNTLYADSLKTFIPLLIDDLNKLIEIEFQYHIIPALIFSSNWRCLTTVVPGLIRCFPDLVQFKYDNLLYDLDMSSVLAHQAYEAIRSLPQAQLSWGSDLADVLLLVLQQLFGYRWMPECVVLNPHQRWLDKVKPLKHLSQGSPKLPSAVYSYLRTQFKRTSKGPFHFYSLPIKLCWKRFFKHNDAHNQLQRWRCAVLLRTIIHYLHKCDRTSAVARLARRSLPKAALRFPRLMKNARRKMDTYVRRWEESPDGLLEKAQSLTINDMD